VIGCLRIDESISVDDRKRRQPMFVCLDRRKDMPDIPAVRNQRIGDQRAMAAPRDSLGAHDRRPPVRAIGHQPFKGFVEFVCLHIVGIPAKTGIAPSVVDRILPSFSKAPKRRYVERGETGLSQTLGQRIRIELWIVS